MNNLTEQAMNIIHQLAACSSTTDKKALISQGIQQNDVFGEVLRYALDPYKKFGFAKKTPTPTPDSTHSLVSNPSNWLYLKKHLNALACGSLSGGNADTTIGHILYALSPSARTLFTRILLKDLRCGVGATLVNSVVPGLIPSFGIMLATPLEPQHLRKLQKQEYVYFQDKKNGDRCPILMGDNPAAYTRNGHEQLNYNHIVDAWGEACHKFGMDLMADGEVIRGDFWGTRATKKKAGNNADDAALFCFDCMTMEEWTMSHTAKYSERKKQLRELFKCVPDTAPLIYVPSQRCKGSDITWESLEYLRDRLMDQGEEGLMIRLDEPYNFETRSSLFKFKKMVEGDFLIVEVLEGETGKKYEGMAGKILIEDHENCILGSGETCEVGLEGDMAFRKELWKHRNNYAGMVCEVHYQELTKNKTGKPKLQFGVMKRVRPEKS